MNRGFHSGGLPVRAGMDDRYPFKVSGEDASLEDFETASLSYRKPADKLSQR